MNRKFSNWLFGLLLAGCIAVLGHAMLGDVGYEADPCTHGVRQAVPINVTSATTTSLIAPVTNQNIWVCALNLNSVGGTSQLEFGTGATCGTNTAVVTGVFPSASTVQIAPGRTILFNSAASGARLCIVSGTSTSGTSGVLTYVQE